jgi:hypothetical protein
VAWCLAWYTSYIDVFAVGKMVVQYQLVGRSMSLIA